MKSNGKGELDPGENFNVHAFILKNKNKASSFTIAPTISKKIGALHERRISPVSVAVAAEYRDAMIKLQDWVISGDSLIDAECELLLSAEITPSLNSIPVLIFPNPAMDKIYIEGSEVELSRVRVFNSLDRDLSSETPIRR